MADLGYLRTLIDSFPSELRPAMLRMVTAIVTDMRFGHPTGDTKDPCTNFGAGFFAGTTHATPNTEFSIAHGFGRTPYLVTPCLPLDQIGSRIVDLTVTRAADDKRVYLSSSVASAPITVIVEG